MKTCNQDGCSLPTTSRSNKCSACKNGLDRYGMTRPQQLALLAEQGNKCCICSDYIEFGGSMGAHVDHCHSTGVVRGILCRDCNTNIIGWIEKKEIDVSSIVSYLDPSLAQLD